MATKITAPVSVVATASFLGLPAERKSYDIGYLCGNTHGRIKVWSASKPMRHPSLLPLTAEQKREVNHGMLPPAFVAAGMPTDASWRAQVWRYGAPRGSFYNEPYRLSDFDGYETDAKAPAETPGTLTIGPLDTGGTVRFVFGSALSIVGTTNLSLHDFAYLDNYYPCVVLYFRDKNGTEYVRCKTGSVKFGATGSYSVEIPVAQIRSLGAVGDIDYFMCGCAMLQTTLGVPHSSSYVVLPCDTPLGDRIIQSDTLPLRLWFDRMTAGIVTNAGLFRGAAVADYNPLGHIIPNPGDDTIHPDEPSGANYKYYNVGNRATLSISIKFSNLGMSSLNIPRTSLYCQVANNLAGYTSPLAQVPSLLRFDSENGSYIQPADAIQLSAGDTAKYLVAWPEYCCVRNASGGIVALGDTKRFNAGFHLYYGSGSGRIALGSIGINISNYTT